MTKYRRKVLQGEHIERLEQVFKSICQTRDCVLVEFNGESDHVHLIIDYPPTLSVSNLVANLKATSSKTMWREFEDHLAKTYRTKHLWTGS